MRSFASTLILAACLIPQYGIAQLNDCVNAAVVCNSENLAFNPIGPGHDDFADPNNFEGCITALEQNSAWYYFEIDPLAPPNLELGFIINPLGGFGEDYDWAVFGPNVDCGNLGSPIRCSSSSAQCGFCPETGMGMGTTDVSEGPGTGDGFVSTMIVQPGQGFYLMIDNWIGTQNGFIMTWTGTAAEYLNCSANPPCSITAFAGDDIDACEGDDTGFELDGSDYGGQGAQTYSWTGTNGGTAFLSDPEIQNPTVTLPPGFTGSIVYTLVVNEETCEGVDEVEVTVHPLPVINIIEEDPMCENALPETLSATPPGGSWGGSVTSNSFNPALNGPGIHEVTYTFSDVYDCSQTASIFIEVYALPDIEIDPDPAQFCDNDGSVILTATGSGGAGGYTYAWSTPSGLGDENTYEATNAGSHVVSVTDANGCVNTDAVTVVTHANPEPEILNAGSICEAVAFFELITNFPGGEFSGANITPEGELYPNLLNPGVYSITYTVIDNNGCEGTDIQNITIVTAPNAFANNTGPYCAGVPIELIGSTDGAGTVIGYQWTGPNGYTSTSQNPTDATVAGVYTLVVNVDGCVTTPATTTVDLTTAPDAAAQNGGPYCNAQMVQLLGSSTSTAGNLTFAWTGPNGYSSTLQNPTDATYAGIYSLIVSSGNCASSAATTDVVFSASPDASAANSGPYCAGQPIILTGNTNTAGTTISYAWTGPNGFVSLSQNPVGAVDPGVYQLVVDVDGCSSNATTTDVVINALPQPTISGPNSFCTGNSATLDAGTGYTAYEWGDGSIIQTLIITSSGTFLVTITDANGCTGSASFSASEIPSLTPVITGDLDFCDGSSTILDAGNGFTNYTWSNGAMGQMISVTDENNYGVTVMDADGCSGSAAVTTSINPNPNVMIGGSTTYCIGGFTTLDAGAGYTSYLWSDNSPTQTIVISSPGNYSVDVIDVNGCGGSAAVDVEESTSLSPVITGINAFCENGSTILSAGAGFATYLWNDGSMVSTLVVDATGIYSVSVSDGQGCFGNSSVAVTEVLPPFAVLNAGTALCNKQTAGSTLNLYDLVLSGDTNGTWDDVDNSGATGLFDNLDFTNVSAGSYRFMYTTNSAVAPCDEVNYEVVIDVNATPTVVIASVDDLDCTHATQSLDAIGSTSGAEYDISWTGPGIVIDGNENSLRPNVDEPGLYELTISNAVTGCSETATITVNENTAAPTDADIHTDQPGCNGELTGAISIDQIIGGTPPFQYQLNGGTFSTDNFYDQLMPGDYLIAVQDANGCTWETSITITDPTAFTIDLGPDQELAFGEQAVIQANVSLPVNQIDTLIWSPEGIIECVDLACLEAVVNSFQTVTITATVIDFNGCEDSDEITITVEKGRRLYIPTTFSPNGDGINDVFYIFGSEAQISMIKKFAIYNRWGDVLQELTDIGPNDPTKGWDGRFKGSPVNPGVFVYVAEIEYVDGVMEVLTGDVTLMR